MYNNVHTNEAREVWNVLIALVKKKTFILKSSTYSSINTKMFHCWFIKLNLI